MKTPPPFPEIKIPYYKHKRHLTQKTIRGVTFIQIDQLSYGMMMYQPFKNVLIPLSIAPMPEGVPPFAAIAVTMGDGTVYYSADFAGERPTWIKVIKVEDGKQD